MPSGLLLCIHDSTHLFEVISYSLNRCKSVVFSLVSCRGSARSRMIYRYTGLRQVLVRIERASCQLHHTSRPLIVLQSPRGEHCLRSVLWMCSHSFANLRESCHLAIESRYDIPNIPCPQLCRHCTSVAAYRILHSTCVLIFGTRSSHPPLDLKIFSKGSQPSEYNLGPTKRISPLCTRINAHEPD